MTIVVTVNSPLSKTYGDLLTDIANWMARDDLTDEIKRFVQMAQSDVCKDLRVRGMEKTTTFSVSNAPVTLPTDYKGARRLYVDAPDRVLDYIPPERFYNSRTLHSGAGTPRAYTIEGESVIFAPLPGTDNPVDVHMAYFGDFTEFSNLADSNSLLSNHYELYLYAALAHGFGYIRDNEEATKWRGTYQEAVNVINRNDNRDRFHGNALKRYVAYSP